MDIANTSAQYIKGVGPDRLRLLKRLGINTIKSCLWYFPRRYEDRSNLLPISKLKVDEYQTIKAAVLSSQVFKTRSGVTIFQIVVGDNTGKLYCLWFHQPYMKRYFKEGNTVILYGKIQKSNRLQVIHPEYEIINEDDPEGEPIHIGRIVPIYPLASGVNQRTLRRIMNNCVKQYSIYVTDFLPTNIRARHRLLDLRSAIKNIHFPINERQKDESRRRLIFDEFFLLQLALAIRRYKMRFATEGKAHIADERQQEEFFKALPFKLTDSQRKAIDDIKKDISSAKSMHRLIQGEVGSGKTAVSAYALFIAVTNRQQAAIMVPTETLARQHYVTLSSLFSSLGIRVVILINGLPKADRKETLSLIESGEADIIVGTHTLIQSGVKFKNLGLITIDEQHKFGVEQRALLKSKTQNPHILVMTATPIPRTMAMTLYGDMDISVIDELPQGKRDVETFCLDTSQLNVVYDFVRGELKQKRQAYIVYPVIDESVALRSEGALKMYNKLKNETFKEYKVGLMHGRLSDGEKTAIMTEFKKGNIDILVATTIIEVGIDVPNASVMVIENAERFGLSQLHQLRGRIGRGKFKSYCILVSDSDSDEVKERLNVISRTEDGFQIAEADLNIRGPGELFGKRQHGVPLFGLGSLVTDIGLLEEARKEAFELISKDPMLKDERHQQIKEFLVSTFKDKFYLGLVG